MTRSEPREDPSIDSAVVTPGHDGQAELLVTLRHAGGALDRVTLDAAQAERLFDRCGVDVPEALAGQSWRNLMFVLEGGAQTCAAPSASLPGAPDAPAQENG